MNVNACNNELIQFTGMSVPYKLSYNNVKYKNCPIYSINCNPYSDHNKTALFQSLQRSATIPK